MSWRGYETTKEAGARWGVCSMWVSQLCKQGRVPGAGKIGGIWLIVRRIIDWKIPLLVLASAAVSVLIFEQDFSAVLPALLSGGLMIGAFFMATDYATSPNTAWGTVVYAVFIGFMTVFFRTFSNYPEGMSFAILLGNILVPLLDKFLIPRPFGAKGADRPKAAGEVRK